jgi:hypothetical protein
LGRRACGEREDAGGKGDGRAKAGQFRTPKGLRWWVQSNCILAGPYSLLAMTTHLVEERENLMSCVCRTAAGCDGVILVCLFAWG